MNFLSGKKTIIGSLILSLAGACWAIDQFVPGEWFTRDQYEAFSLFVGGLTGISMRIGIDTAAAKKPE